MPPVAKTKERKQAIQLLATGATQRTTARRLGLAENTVMRWMKQPDFRDQVARARRETLEPTDIRESLIGALGAMRQDGVTPAWETRVAAARVLATLPIEESARETVRYERVYYCEHCEHCRGNA